MKLRYIIVDDEFLARQRLSKLLENNNRMVLVGECRNGQEALKMISLKEPDLIFLDIQMPDINGFEVLSKLKSRPHVIFTTAYDQYALKAFEINAVDYLLKPFDEERLSASLDRIFKLHQQRKASEIELKLKQLMLSYAPEREETLSHIDFKEKGRTRRIPLDDIVYFQSDGNYVRLITQHKQYLYRCTMNNLYQKLDMEQFLRVHRGLVINKFYIKQCTYSGNNSYKLYLKTGDMLESSRSYKHLIDDYLNTLHN